MKHTLVRLGRQVPKIGVSEIHEHPLRNASLHGQEFKTAN